MVLDPLIAHEAPPHSASLRVIAEKLAEKEQAASIEFIFPFEIYTQVESKVLLANAQTGYLGFHMSAVEYERSGKISRVHHP